MKSILFLFLMLCGICNCYPQITFDKYYPIGSTYQMEIIELNSGNIHTGIGANMLLDDGGNIIHSCNYLYMNGIYPPQSISKYRENEFYFVGAYMDGTCINWEGNVQGQFYPVFGKLDSLGSVLSVRSYELDNACRSIPKGLEITQVGSIITWGRDGSLFALKVDSNLNHVWSKQFYRDGEFQFIKELPSGDLLAGINMDTAGAVVARMDAEGNFLWCKSYIRPEGRVHDAIIESDSSFIISSVRLS